MTHSPTSPEVRIRRAAPADAGTIHQMVTEIADLQGQTAQVAATPVTWRDVLARDDVTCFLAEIADQPAGYVSTVRRLHLWRAGDIVALDDLFVREAWRNHGVGRRLMRAVAEYADADGLTVAWGVEPDNVDAQRFYSRLGATLHAKVQVSWPPSRYRVELSSVQR